MIISNTGLSGAGLLNEGAQATTTVEQTQISFNATTLGGGGGINNSGTLSLIESTIDHNSARSGGGIDHSGFSLNLTNVTISQNEVSDNGGGLYNRNSASLTNVTIDNNRASGPFTGGNIYNDGDTAVLTAVNTIVANPGNGGNCFNNEGIFNSSGHNLDSENSCEFTASGDLVNINPLLGPLQDNGGATLTQALLSGSQAIDNGDNNACPPTDQRGVTRPQGAACDIGAYEYAGTADLSISKTVSAPEVILAGQPVTYTLTLTNAGPTAPVSATVVDTWTPASAVTSASAPGCEVNLTAGTATCAVTNLGIEMVQVSSPHLVLTTSVNFGGTLDNIVHVSPTGGVTDLNQNNNDDGPVSVSIVRPLDVALSGDQTKQGLAGQAVLYTLWITNTGQLNDTYDLSASSLWSTMMSTNVINLAAQTSNTFTVTVNIPLDAVSSEADQATIQATSRTNSHLNDTVVLRTEVTSNRTLFLPVVLFQADGSGTSRTRSQMEHH